MNNKTYNSLIFVGCAAHVGFNSFSLLIFIILYTASLKEDWGFEGIHNVSSEKICWLKYKEGSPTLRV